MTNINATAVNSPAEHDWLSKSYVDAWVADWSARAERVDQLRRLAVALPAGRFEAINVLDVGAGWGPLAEEVLAYRPHASVTVADFSPPMLDHARERLARFGDRVRFEECDLTDPQWTAGFGEPFDAVVSALAIHNLGDPDAIAGVYRDILASIRPGGWFFNLEVIFAGGPGLAAISRRLRAEERGADPDAVQPAPPSSVAPGTARPGALAVSPIRSVPPRSLESQLEWLREAGFAEVDCLWRSGGLGFLAARR